MAVNKKPRMEFRSGFKASWRDSTKIRAAAERVYEKMGWYRPPVRVKVGAGVQDITKTPGYDGFKF